MIDLNRRVTEKQCQEAWSIFADREKYFSLSKDEEILVDAYVEAGQMKQVSGEWPTLQEVQDKWIAESEERARKRNAMIQECAAHSANKSAV